MLPIIYRSIKALHRRALKIMDVKLVIVKQGFLLHVWVVAPRPGQWIARPPAGGHRCSELGRRRVACAVSRTFATRQLPTTPHTARQCRRISGDLEIEIPSGARI